MRNSPQSSATPRWVHVTACAFAPGFGLIEFNSMTYYGKIKNGVAVINSPVPLPEGTLVRVDVEPSGSDFRNGNSFEELAREQRVMLLSSTGELAIDWPREDSIEDLLTLVREARR